jgi:hypothetical protein
MNGPRAWSKIGSKDGGKNMKGPAGHSYVHAAQQKQFMHDA